MQNGKQVQQLGQVLIQMGFINEATLQEALNDQKISKDFLGKVLLKRKFINDTQLSYALSKQFGIPLAKSVNDLKIDWSVVMGFSGDLILKSRCFPFRDDGNAYWIAISDPLNAWGMARAEEEAKRQTLRYVLVKESDMDQLLTFYREHLQQRIKSQLDNL